MFFSPKYLPITILAVIVLGGCESTAKADPVSSASKNAATGEQQNPRARQREAILQAIEVVQKSNGVFFYEYKGDNVLKPLNPYEDYIAKKEITNAGLIGEIKALIKENQDFQPDYKKRCYPKWTHGVEFRKSEEESQLILFAFDCNTMMLYESKTFRDFDPQKVRFYALLNYQVNDRTANPID